MTGNICWGSVPTISLFYREGGSLTAKVQTSWPEGFTVEGLPAWISYSIKPSDPDKTAPTDEKTVTFTVTEHVDASRRWPEKPEDAQNTLKAAYVKAGRMKWFLGFEQSKDINVTLQILRTRPAAGRWSLLRSISMARAMGRRIR